MFVVNIDAAISNSEIQLATAHAPDVDDITHEILVGRDLSGELHLSHAQRAALAGKAEPAKMKADQPSQ